MADLTGEKLGRLTVIGRQQRSKGRAVFWQCVCDCGKSVVVCESHLKGGVRSCGCLKKEHIRDSKYKEIPPKTKARLYSVWTNMKVRCYNENDKKYKYYGGRGISICSEWLNDFKAFYKWAMANGYDPEAPHGECTIDRIDVNGNYCPKNCRWVNMKTQQNNKRNTKRRE